MSGLTCFFRDYIVNNDDTTTTTTTHTYNYTNYHQSLASCTARRKDHDDNNKNENHDDSQQQQSGSSSETCRSSHPKNNYYNNNNNNLVQIIEEPLDYQKCKVWRREFLQAFLDNRMTRPNDSEDEEEDEDDEQHQPKLQHQHHHHHHQQQAGEPTTPVQQDWRDTQFETQQDFVPQPQPQQPPPQDTLINSRSPPPPPPRLTPHLRDTLHHIEYIQDLDLMTRTATLLICPCHTVWPRRWIHRTKQAVWPRRGASTNNKLYCSTQQLPLLSMDACQEDGPLSSCYNTKAAAVCSFQVSQYNMTDLRQRAELAAGGTGTAVVVAAADGNNNNRSMTTMTRTTTSSSGHRSWLLLNVYLYNAYATVLEKLQQRYGSSSSSSKTKKYQMVFSFHNIPAKCILPCPAQDWYDRMNVSDCCLCIGDESILSIREDHHPTNDSDNDNDDDDDEEQQHVPVRFDDEDMRIYVGFVDLQENTLSENDVYCLIPHADTTGVIVRRVGGGAGDSNNNTNENPFVGYPEKKQQQQNEMTPPQQQQQPPERSTETTTTTTMTTSVRHPESVRELPPAAAAAATTPEARPSKQAPSPMQAVKEPEFTSRKRQRPADESIVREEDEEATTTAAAAQRPRNEQSQWQQQQQRQTAPPPPPSNGQRPQQQQQQQQKQEVHYETIGALQEVFAQHQALAQADPKSSGPCIINLHGVVIGFSPPSTTKRGDYMMGIALVDQTVPLAADQGSDVEKVHTVNINIFTKNKDLLPKILYAGDVLRMHRVKLQQWKDDMQLMGMRASSYVVFRGNIHDPAATNEWTVLRTSQTSQVSQVEHERMQTLWTWGQKRILSHPTMKEENSFNLCDVMHQESNMMATETGLGKDITVMVSAILPIPEHQLTGVSPRGFLRVWDGTGTPDSDPYPLPGAMVDGANDPPSSALVQLAALIKKLQFIRQNPDLQPPKVVAGRVVNVAIWEKAHWELVNQAVRVGSFIRLRNVRDDRLPNSGLHCLMVLPKSYLTPLPNLCYEVVKLLEEHNSRLLRKEPENPQSGILPLNYEEQGDNVEQEAMDTSEPVVPGSPSPPRQQRETRQFGRTFQKLTDLLSAPVDSLFEGTIRVITIIPSMSNLASGGLEQICMIKDNEQIHSYCFGVRIRDETHGEIDAIVMDEAIGQVLVGMPAEDALKNSLGALFNLHRTIQEQEARQATIKSIAHLGTKYFVLQSLQSNYV